MREIDLDVRFLDPPEPFERTIEALDRMQPGDVLRLLIHREPHPLYQMLRSSGYTCRGEMREDGMWVVTIRMAQPPE